MDFNGLGQDLLQLDGQHIDLEPGGQGLTAGVDAVVGGVALFKELYYGFA